MANKKLTIAGALLLGIVFTVIWLLLSNPRLYPIKTIQIQASYQHINPDTLQNTITAHLTGNFFTLDVRQLKKSILQLPWVYSVDIKRVWPDKLIVYITEQTAVACWNNNALFNAAGQIFQPGTGTARRAPTCPADLPQLQGPTDQIVEVWQHYQQMNSLLFSKLGLTISKLTFDPQGIWQLTLDNHIKVYLQNTDNEQQLMLFIKAYPKVIVGKIKRIDSVDMRYNETGFAIKWKNSHSN